MKVNKKITAMLLSAVIAAAPAAAPIMDVQTVAAATTTTKTLKNAWSKNHKYYYDKNGKKVTGVKKIGKYTYVFAKNGKLVTNKKYYKYNAKTYYKIAKNGRAKILSAVETLAASRLKKCGGNLKKAFNWSSSVRYAGNYKVAKKNVANYAKYGFQTGRGDCYVQAATFYQMAKVAGYDAKYVKGSVNKGKGLAPHAWVEIKSNGKTYVYDPNFQSEFGKKGYTGYKITYGQKGTLQYVKTSKGR